MNNLGKKFKKKPVVVRAFLNDMWSSIEIKTLEGVMKANYGDYIIEGVSGEYYPCKPDIFKKTYEEVEE